MLRKKQKIWLETNGDFNMFVCMVFSPSEDSGRDLAQVTKICYENAFILGDLRKHNDWSASYCFLGRNQYKFSRAMVSYFSLLRKR